MNIRILLLLLLFLGQIGYAQVMPDPTRPANKVVEVEQTDESGKPVAPIVEGQEPVEQITFPTANLSAIVVTEDVKYAIINNQVVYEGQQWRNVVLKTIKPYSITLSLNDKNKEITINNNDFITESDENF